MEQSRHSHVMEQCRNSHVMEWSRHSHTVATSWSDEITETENDTIKEQRRGGMTLRDDVAERPERTWQSNLKDRRDGMTWRNDVME